MQRYLASLRCTRCAVERPHAVTYLGNVFASATCTVCAETFRPRAELLHYLPRGLVSKPREVLQEWEVLARSNQAEHGPVRDAAGAAPPGR